MFPGEVTRVIAKFDLPGRYEWHCHILSHEDHDMMRPFMVREEFLTNSMKAPQNALPESSVIKNNVSVYPNPFAAHTTIQFKISAPGKVSIKIFDIEGRVVSTVFEGDRPAGTYHLSFNKDQLSAGLYLCRMQINDQFLQQKFIIQR
jgi:spore coat protein A